MRARTSFRLVAPALLAAALAGAGCKLGQTQSLLRTDEGSLDERIARIEAELDSVHADLETIHADSSAAPAAPAATSEPATPAVSTEPADDALLDSMIELRLTNDDEDELDQLLASSDSDKSAPETQTEESGALTSAELDELEAQVRSIKTDTDTLESELVAIQPEGEALRLQDSSAAKAKKLTDAQLDRLIDLLKKEKEARAKLAKGKTKPGAGPGSGKQGPCNYVQNGQSLCKMATQTECKQTLKGGFHGTGGNKTCTWWEAKVYSGTVGVCVNVSKTSKQINYCASKAYSAFPMTNEGCGRGSFDGTKNGNVFFPGASCTTFPNGSRMTKAILTGNRGEFSSYTPYHRRNVMENLQ